jgi:hypothetical protein
MGIIEELELENMESDRPRDMTEADIILEKVGVGTRPIAVGEVWRRLFAKVIMRSQAPAVRAYIEPL